jgi:hypothetical protein
VDEHDDPTEEKRRTMMIVLVVAAWILASVVVALLLGSVVAVRNRQVPRAEVSLPVPRATAEGPFTGGAGRRAPVPGG